MGWCGQHPFRTWYILPYRLKSLDGHLKTSYSRTVDTFLLFFMFSSLTKTLCQYYPLCSSTIDWLDFGSFFPSEEHCRKLVAKMWQGNKRSSGPIIKNRTEILDWNWTKIFGCCVARTLAQMTYFDIPKIPTITTSHRLCSYVALIICCWSYKQVSFPKSAFP